MLYMVCSQWGTQAGQQRISSPTASAETAKAPGTTTGTTRDQSGTLPNFEIRAEGAQRWDSPTPRASGARRVWTATGPKH